MTLMTRRRAVFAGALATPMLARDTDCSLSGARNTISTERFAARQETRPALSHRPIRECSQGNGCKIKKLEEGART